MKGLSVTEWLTREVAFDSLSYRSFSTAIFGNTLIFLLIRFFVVIYWALMMIMRLSDTILDISFDTLGQKSGQNQTQCQE